MDNSIELKSFFDDIINRINVPSFIDNDPVQFPHRYDLIQDKEISGLLTALIAWGKREMIIQNADKMLSIMGCSPYEWIMEKGYESLPYHTIHRTFNTIDLQFICRGLHSIYSSNDTMENLFIGKDMFDGIETLREMILTANDCPGFRSEKHLASPSKNSACKRIHMFLKWMVRNDKIVDLGIWKNISPASLYIPLDTHVVQISHHFELIARKQNDRKAVEELTRVLQSYCPEDPVKYDYALFGLGVYGYLKNNLDIKNR